MKKVGTILLACTLSLLAGATVPERAPESWRQVWRSMDVDPFVAESVVWPEYQLYSRFRDMAETAAVYFTYILTGSGPDYSIGVFQMKPSFVEKIEKAWMRSGMSGDSALHFDTADSAQARRSRIQRMSDDSWQIVYVGIFLRLLYDSYGSYDEYGLAVQEGLDALPTEDQVRLAATAYNRGCLWTEAGFGSPDSLRVNSGLTSFPRIIIRTPGSRQYCYATLAWEHYQKVSGTL